MNKLNKEDADDFLFSSYKSYMEKLTPFQVESIKELKRKRSQDKVKRQVRRDKKRESDFLGKPKYPGNAFLLYVSTLDRGEAAARVSFMLFMEYLFHKLVILHTPLQCLLKLGNIFTCILV